MSEQPERRYAGAPDQTQRIITVRLPAYLHALAKVAAKSSPRRSLNGFCVEALHRAVTAAGLADELRAAQQPEPPEPTQEAASDDATP